jgi:hypothetical protein
VVPQLKPGSYGVVIELAGFKTATVDEIKLDVQQIRGVGPTWVRRRPSGCFAPAEWTVPAGVCVGQCGGSVDFELNARSRPGLR